MVTSKLVPLNEPNLAVAAVLANSDKDTLSTPKSADHQIQFHPLSFDHLLLSTHGTLLGIPLYQAIGGGMREEKMRGAIG